MRLGELFGRAGLEYPAEAENIEIKNIVTDSRQVENGSMFICIKGLRHNGHDYIDGALENGAVVVVAEEKRDVCVGGAAAFIMLDNTRKATTLLYNAFYQEPVEKLKIIGVTGTNGKTTVSTLLYEIFAEAGYSVGLIGTLCSMSKDRRVIEGSGRAACASLTTPEPDELYRQLAEMVNDGVEYVFVEVSSHALILGRVEGIEFDCAVFTNLSRDHLDFHKTMNEYFKAKSRLFAQSRRGLVNISDDYGKRLARSSPCPVNTCSVTEGELCASEIVSRGFSGSSFIHRGMGEDIFITTPMIGRYAVENIITAVSVAKLYGIGTRTIQNAVAGFRGVAGRSEIIDVGGEKITVIVDYAHTPDALEKLLLSIGDICPLNSRIILVFGCGGERDRGKRRLMGAIATRLAHRVIVTSDNSRGEDTNEIIKDILKGIDKEKSYSVIPDRRMAITTAICEARDGDTVILAGKGHEKYEIVGGEKRPFDEIEIVKNACAVRSGKCDGKCRGEEN